MIFQSVSWCTLLNAFSKSIKQMYILKLEFLRKFALYSIFLRIKICSVVPHPSVNPACSSLNKCLFTSSPILLMIIFPRILDIVCISVIPLQFPQKVSSSPFFCNITCTTCIRPFFQSVGLVSSSHILVQTTTFSLNFQFVEKYLLTNQFFGSKQVVHVY